MSFLTAQLSSLKPIRMAILKQILGKMGRNISFEVLFHAHYGWNITIGDNFFAKSTVRVVLAHFAKIETTQFALQIAASLLSPSFQSRFGGFLSLKCTSWDFQSLPT